LASGDFDGGGFLDLVLAQSTSSDLSLYLNLSSPAAARDCDSNGMPDSCDIAGGLARDRNANGVPDDCDRPLFHRGDPNASGTSDISDAVAIFGFLFLGNPATLSCTESADANNDGRIDVSDGIYLLNWRFTGGGQEPAAPGPPSAHCGFDPDPPESPGDLGCAAYAPCQ
jgi:hypothetical protein